MVHLLWISVPAEDFPVFRWLYSFRKYNSIWLTVSERSSRTSRGGSYRFEERNIPSLPGRRGKTAFRFCCQPGSHAIGRPGQNIPQKCKERTAERIAQRIDMSEGGELQHEIQAFQKQAIVVELGDHFKEEFFKLKSSIRTVMITIKAF